MDTFTLSVVISASIMILAMIALIVVDKKKPAIEAVKPAAGKR